MSKKNPANSPFQRNAWKELAVTRRAEAKQQLEAELATPAPRPRPVRTKQPTDAVPMPFATDKESTMTGLMLSRCEALDYLMISAKGPRNGMMGVAVPTDSRWNQRKRRAMVGKQYSRYHRRTQAQAAQLTAEYEADLAAGRDVSWY